MGLLEPRRLMIKKASPVILGNRSVKDKDVRI